MLTLQCQKKKRHPTGGYLKQKNDNKMNFAIYNGLNFSTKEINRNFRIKVSGIYNGKKINKLVGILGLINIIDDMELVNKMFAKAFAGGEDKLVCKLRRGIKISFYVK